MNTSKPPARPGGPEPGSSAGATLSVAIAGAGLGGLCLAQSLVRAGIDVQVYERDPGPFVRRQGYRITVDQSGQAALQQCLPARLSELATAVSGAPGGYFRFTNKDLRDAFKLTFKAGPGGQMDRQTLRAILLIGLEDRVHYGRQATGVTEGPDGATLHFGDGTSVTASVAVGADGSSSLLRAQVLPGHEPADSGSMALYGRTPLMVGGRPMMPPALGKSGVLAIGDEPGHAVFFTAMQFGEPPGSAFARLAPGYQPPAGDNYVMWGLVLPARQNPLTVDEPDQAALDQQAGALARHFHPAIRELVARAEPGYTLQARFTIAQRPRGWPMSRATLMGDAVHVMPPFGAHGGNTALRDAALLAGKLRQAARGGSAAVALAEYQHEMTDYAFEAVESAAKSMRRLTDSSRLQRWFLLRLLPRLHPVTVS